MSATEELVRQMTAGPSNRTLYIIMRQQLVCHDGENTVLLSGKAVKEQDDTFGFMFNVLIFFNGTVFTFLKKPLEYIHKGN
jgi:hypothetical protein